MSIQPIIIDALIKVPRESVWEYYHQPSHIVHWNFASDEWFCPQASNDFFIGGRFCYTMASKDGIEAFNFEGRYLDIVDHQKIHYQLEDHRKVIITFEAQDQETHIVLSFEPEDDYPNEIQKKGWYAILMHFKTYAEATYETTQ